MRDVASQFREYAALERKRVGAGLTPVELRRWMLLKRALAKRFSPGLGDGADRRTSVRVPTRVKVTFQTEDDLVESMMTNVSSGGVFVATSDLVEIGTLLTLRIHIEETGQDVEVPVSVCSHNVGPPSMVGQRGMGVAFRDMDPVTEKQVMDLYERALHVAADESKSD